MPSNVLPTELELATKIAWRIGSRWKLINEEDLASHLTLWLFENAATLAKWRTTDFGNGRLFVSLRREALKFCASETAAEIGQPIDANRFYSVERIRKIMPFTFEETPQTLVIVNPITGATQGDTGASGEALAILADVRAVYYGLPPHLRELLALRYRDGLSYEELGELRKLTPEAARKAVNRALKRLSDELGGE